MPPWGGGHKRGKRRTREAVWCGYQSEVHDGLGHQLPQEAELHLDFGDVCWFGGSAEGDGEQPSGAEHVLCPLLTSCGEPGQPGVTTGGDTVPNPPHHPTPLITTDTTSSDEWWDTWMNYTVNSDVHQYKMVQP